MVSITLSIPKELREKMREHDEINWSGLVRKTIEQKVKELIWKEKMIKQLKEEEEFTNWTIEIGRKAKKGRFKKLLSQLSPKEKEELLNERNDYPRQ